MPSYLKPRKRLGREELLLSEIETMADDMAALYTHPAAHVASLHPADLRRELEGMHETMERVLTERLQGFANAQMPPDPQVAVGISPRQHPPAPQQPDPEGARVSPRRDLPRLPPGTAPRMPWRSMMPPPDAPFAINSFQVSGNLNVFTDIDRNVQMTPKNPRPSQNSVLSKKGGSRGVNRVASRTQSEHGLQSVTAAAAQMEQWEGSHVHDPSAEAVLDRSIQDLVHSTRVPEKTKEVRRVRKGGTLLKPLGITGGSG